VTTPGPDPDHPSGRPRAIALQLRRLALVGSQLALVLPFATVEDCNGAEPLTVTGVKVALEHNGWPMGVPLLFAVALLAFSFRSRPSLPGWRTFSASVRALLAAASVAVVIVVPHLVWLFDTVRPRAGWVLVVGCWVFVYLEGLVVGAIDLRRARGEASVDLWDPVCRALRWIALVVPWPVALLTEPDLDEALFGAGAATLILSVPIWLALSACVGGMRAREPWSAGWAPVAASIVGAAMAFSALAAAAQ